MYCDADTAPGQDAKRGGNTVKAAYGIDTIKKLATEARVHRFGTI